MLTILNFLLFFKIKTSTVVESNSSSEIQQLQIMLGSGKNVLLKDLTETLCVVV